MFPNVLRLNINKRIRADQRDLLREIEEEIWSCQTQHDIWKVVSKHFGRNIINCLDDLKTNGIKRALSYFRTSKKTLNRRIQGYANNMNSKSIVLEDGLRYHEGDVLNCKMNMKLKHRCDLWTEPQLHIQNQTNREGASGPCGCFRGPRVPCFTQSHHE